jgi:hypothetical protein
MHFLIRGVDPERTIHRGVGLPHLAAPDGDFQDIEYQFGDRPGGLENSLARSLEVEMDQVRFQMDSVI